jgi:hypothetical protein
MRRSSNLIILLGSLLLIPAAPTLAQAQGVVVGIMAGISKRFWR